MKRVVEGNVDPSCTANFIDVWEFNNRIFKQRKPATGKPHCYMCLCSRPITEDVGGWQEFRKVGVYPESAEGTSQSFRFLAPTHPTYPPTNTPRKQPAITATTMVWDLAEIPGGTPTLSGFPWA